MYIIIIGVSLFSLESNNAFETFGNPVETVLHPSGIFFALDKDTGKKLWEFNVGGPSGVGGASAGDGMIFATTGSASARPSFTSGSIIAFGIE